MIEQTQLFADHGKVEHKTKRPIDEPPAGGGATTGRDEIGHIS